ncbi:AI-2E family transporter [Histidinibacterium lentulum]|uniref:AI-2E family transporter n=1 Tax=Histidinibacterium lentulum TaxID=2480588 RepID=A0A3N2R0U7_9RHOB|nr:AI-2E family transporter [Histidinibacterium lentulum]ROU01092.1 AI-2E family transporter [Histidinibacterium lentulum]
MKNAPFLNLVLAVILVIAVGWLLVAGRPIILPIVTAVISVYVMVSASDMLGRMPILGRAPKILLRALVLLAFTVAVLAFAVVVAGTVRDIAAALPVYQENIEAMVQAVAQRFDLESQMLWDEIRAVTLERIDMQQLVLAALGGFTSVGITVFLVVIYAGFLIGERGVFPAKISAALTDAETASKTLRVITDINGQISQYLSVKTLINLILGLISYAILWLLGVDFALFWAITIALLNYIPYVGSYLGVAFPVILSLGQFASLQTTLVLLAMLVAAQVWVGNVLEPRWIGRQLNMSPFVVLVALSVWSALWGIPGAILAIPMTSILIIVTSNFESTRFIAVLLSERGDTARPEPAKENAA